jgi:cytochrome d ubiquinol oxidase subunit II
VTIATLLALVTVAALNAYLVSGGADFGGGVWDLLASGPRRRRQQDLIAHAIAPIWEANHVWLILAIVLLFTCFPPAFSAIATILHIPLTLMLIGIVLRGSAFVFRAYDTKQGEARRRWGPPFAVTSLVTPLLLGTSVGALAAGRVGEALDAMRSGERGVVALYVTPWLAPFPIAVGIMTVVLFAMLAAVYLTVEASDEPELREDFRRRALGAAAASAVLAAAGLPLAAREPSRLHVGLLASAWSVPFLAATALSALGVIVALLTRRFRLARVAAMAQVTLICWGWAAAQYPRIVPNGITIDNAAAPESTLRPIFWTLVVGAAVLVPSLVYLFRLFKGQDGPRPNGAG